MLGLQIDRAVEIYNLTELEERVAACTAVLHVYSILRSLIARAPPVHQRLSMFSILQRPH